MIFISGSRPLAMPSNVISWVKSKAKLPSNLIPWLAEIESIPYIVVPTFISGIGISRMLSKCLLSFWSKLASTSGLIFFTDRLLIKSVHAYEFLWITDHASWKKFDWSRSLREVTIPASINASLISKLSLLGTTLIFGNLPVA